MTTTQPRPTYALVVDASTDPPAAAAALVRAAKPGRGHVVLVSCDPAATSRIRRHVGNRFSSVTVHSRLEAASVIRGLRPLRVAFQLADPLEFSALLLDDRRLEAAA
jgi:hypothetical protein